MDTPTPNQPAPRRRTMKSSPSLPSTALLLCLYLCLPLHRGESATIGAPTGFTTPHRSSSLPTASVTRMNSVGRYHVVTARSHPHEATFMTRQTRRSSKSLTFLHARGGDGFGGDGAANAKRSEKNGKKKSSKKKQNVVGDGDEEESQDEKQRRQNGQYIKGLMDNLEELLDKWIKTGTMATVSLVFIFIVFQELHIIEFFVFYLLISLLTFLHARDTVRCMAPYNTILLPNLQMKLNCHPVETTLQFTHLFQHYHFSQSTIRITHTNYACF